MATNLILEREFELRELERLLRSLPEDGGVALIEGAAGVGKTTLVRELQTKAASAGVNVLAARGSELEHAFAYGAVRQLLEATVARLAPELREEILSGAARLANPVISGRPAPLAPVRGAPPPEAVLHGLYWLVSNLAEQRPLVLAFDDAHWLDEPSLDFLEYLTRRLDGIPVLVVAAARSDEPGTALDRLRRLAGHGVTLRPDPLSPEGVGRLARSRLGADTGAEIADACHQASGGNPFLLGELLTALGERLDGGDVITAVDVPKIEAPGVAALVAGRLSRIGGAAPRLATALAVLGDASDLQHAAALAGVPAAVASKTADAMAEAMIIAPSLPLAFAHPLIGAAVDAQLGAAERARLHAMAARLLADSGISTERVATHLLETEPGADPWVVEVLGAAANVSLGRGSPQAAAMYLRRAVSEPPPPDAEASVLVELGTAESLAGDPGGVDHLREGLDRMPAGDEFAQTARTLAQGLIPLGRLEEAVQTLDRAIDQLSDGDDDLALELEAEAASAGRMSRTTFEQTANRLRRFEGRLEGDTAGERLVLANLAAQQLIGGTAGEAAAIARRCLDGGLLAERTSASATVYDALVPAVIADDFALARRFCESGLDDARSRGSLRDVGVNLMFRSHLAYREGQVADAEADASAALDVAMEGGYIFAMTAAAFLIDALIERGELQAAEDALARVGGHVEIPDTWMTDWLLHSRGVLRISRGDFDRGLIDLELLGQRERGYLGENPSVYPYRSQIALVLSRQGAVDKAAELATEELELARRWGSARAIGIAQRALGLVADDGIETLQMAVATLAPSGARLEHARALVDLGAALRRAGKRREARETLSAGMDLAHRCGGTALASKAREELVVAGARPRRMARTGVDALTASERRTAQMAAAGLTNKEIAQSLFVTVRTVEMHLGNAYRKLEVSSRKELDPGLFD